MRPCNEVPGDCCVRGLNEGSRWEDFRASASGEQLPATAPSRLPLDFGYFGNPIAELFSVRFGHLPDAVDVPEEVRWELQDRLVRQSSIHDVIIGAGVFDA